MALVKCPAAGVLTGQSHRNSGFDEASQSQRLSHAVIDRALAFAHLSPLLQQLLYLGMNVKGGRITDQPFTHLLQFLGADRSLHLVFLVVSATLKIIPVGR